MSPYRIGSVLTPSWVGSGSEVEETEEESEDEYDLDDSGLLSHIARGERKDYSHPALDEELLETGLDISGFEMRVMNLNRTCKSTKAGGLTRYSALVMCGNRKGLVGYALSKVRSRSAKPRRRVEPLWWRRYVRKRGKLLTPFNAALSWPRSALLSPWVHEGRRRYRCSRYSANHKLPPPLTSHAVCGCGWVGAGTGAALRHGQGVSAGVQEPILLRPL